MKKLSVTVQSTSNAKIQKATFCELSLKANTVKTKVFKGDTTIEQAFSLGTFSAGDVLQVVCKAKRAGDILATSDVSLEPFLNGGRFDYTVSFEATIDILLQFEVTAVRGGIRRSSSIQNIKDKFTKFLKSSDDKKEKEKEKGEDSSIPHSRSHLVDLGKQNAPESMKRTASTDELERPRRRRKRTKVPGEDGEVTKKKKERKGPRRAVTDRSVPVTGSPKRERRKKRRSLHEKDEEPEKTDKVKDKEKKKEKEKDKESKEEKEEEVKTNEKSTITDSNIKQKKEKPKKKEPLVEVKEKKESEIPTVVLRDKEGSDKDKDLDDKDDTKRRTVVLQPIGGTQTKLFGVPLEEVMERQKVAYPDLEVPVFFVTAAKIIKEKGYDVKGIFRIRGKLKEVKELKQKIDSGEELEEDFSNIHLLATVLKAFLRELPVPILTFENYDAFIGAHSAAGDEQIKQLAEIMEGLPKQNYNLLKFLFSLLHDLSLHAEETQMTADNLAKVISPNLIWKKELDILDLSAVQDTMKGNDLAVVMIQQHEKLFPN